MGLITNALLSAGSGTLEKGWDGLKHVFSEVADMDFSDPVSYVKLIGGAMGGMMIGNMLGGSFVGMIGALAGAYLVPKIVDHFTNAAQNEEQIAHEQAQTMAMAAPPSP